MAVQDRQGVADRPAREGGGHDDDSETEGHRPESVGPQQSRCQHLDEERADRLPDLRHDGSHGGRTKPTERVRSPAGLDGGAHKTDTLPVNTVEAWTPSKSMTRVTDGSSRDGIAKEYRARALLPGARLPPKSRAATFGA